MESTPPQSEAVLGYRDRTCGGHADAGKGSWTLGLSSLALQCEAAYMEKPDATKMQNFPEKVVGDKCVSRQHGANGRWKDRTPKSTTRAASRCADAHAEALERKTQTGSRTHMLTTGHSKRGPGLTSVWRDEMTKRSDRSRRTR